MNAAQKSRRNATRSDRRHAAVKRRKELEKQGDRARQAAMARARRRKRILGVVGVAAALALITVGALLVIRDNNKPNLSLTGAKVSSKAASQAIAGLPTTYRLTYHVDTGDAEAPIVEELVVKRPDSLRYRIANEGALDTPFQDLIVTDQFMTQHSQDTGDDVERLAKNLLPHGARFDVTLQDLIDNGFYVRRERRKILDTECTVYRTGQILESTAVTKASNTRHTDVCISDDGLMLEEVSVVDGKVEVRVQITNIEREPALDDTAFPVDTDATKLDATGVTRFDLDVATTPTTPYWQWTTAPSGWTLSSRQRIETTRAADGSTDSGPVAARVSWIDVYRRGNDVLILRQGLLGNEPSSIDASSGVDVPVGDIGPMKLVYGTMGTRLVTDDVNGSFVQVLGTTSAKELTDLAGALTLTK